MTDFARLQLPSYAATRFSVGLSWQARTDYGMDFDLDLSVFLLDATGQVAMDDDFIFYHQRRSRCGSIHLSEDDRAGETRYHGFNEIVDIHLQTLPQTVMQLALVVTTHDSAQENHCFEHMAPAQVTIFEPQTQHIWLSLALDEDFYSADHLWLLQGQRNPDAMTASLTDWAWRLPLSTQDGGLIGYCQRFGVQVNET